MYNAHSYLQAVAVASADAVAVSGGQTNVSCHRRACCRASPRLHAPACSWTHLPLAQQQPVALGLHPIVGAGSELPQGCWSKNLGCLSTRGPAQQLVISEPAAVVQLKG